MAKIVFDMFLFLFVLYTAGKMVERKRYGLVFLNVALGMLMFITIFFSIISQAIENYFG